MAFRKRLNISVVCEEREYVPFNIVSVDNLGKQMGIVDGDEKEQVYEYEGDSTDQWIVSYYESGEMDTALLMKEISVEHVLLNVVSEYNGTINITVK